MFRYVMFVAVFAISKFAMAFSYTVEISEQELQEKVAAMMPLERKVFFVTVTLTDSKVDLIKDNNEIGVQTVIAVTLPGGFKGNGLVEVTGSIAYDSDKGAFFFHNPTIVRLDIEQVPEKYVPKIKQIAQLIVSEAMSQYPVYKFKDDDVKHQLAKSTLKSVTIENEQLLVTLGML